MASYTTPWGVSVRDLVAAVVLKNLSQRRESIVGYQLFKEVVPLLAAPDDRWKPSYDLFYNHVLARLEEHGLIQGTYEKPPAGWNRRFYQITDKGQRMLQQDLQQLREPLQAGLKRMQGIYAYLYG